MPLSKILVAFLTTVHALYLTNVHLSAFQASLTVMIAATWRKSRSVSLTPTTKLSIIFWPTRDGATWCCVNKPPIISTTCGQAFRFMSHDGPHQYSQERTRVGWGWQRRRIWHTQFLQRMDEMGTQIMFDVRANALVYLHDPPLGFPSSRTKSKFLRTKKKPIKVSSLNKTNGVSV